ncbi:delta-1-pyrroline-5-carboxylate dehydrogenase, mitochondrial-like [Lineus longissimus]|uniref:delta-1-pyrroline-5-carboxylate dehydrogenase, mitochondrial-like n=1 Tax=Lineus longissimus TaxID=88925 RepID=UPI002B4F431F
MFSQRLNPLGLIKRITVMSCRPLTYESFLKYTCENEPVLDYLAGSEERKNLEAALKKYEGVTEVPICIGDEEIKTSDIRHQVAPFDHQRKVAKFHYATPAIVQKGIDSCMSARKDWEATPIEKRAEIFLKAADLIAGKYRGEILATTMLGQGKTIVQAEIDAAPELIDFLRFNVMFAAKNLTYTPISTERYIDTLRYRGMEGFWAAVSPFNFTAIGGNLSGTPALMGNVVMWKPSDTAVLSNYLVYRIYREAGLPPGVINFVTADGPVFGNAVTASPDLCGVNFTGSVKTFQHLWKQVGMNLEKYKTYPRLIGECGGKNYHFVHKSADTESVINGTIKSGFEFGGQKCSACSRIYVPESKWAEVKDGLIARHKQIKLGSPLEQDSYLSAVIDDKAFGRIKSYIDHAKTAPDLTVIAGGKYDDSKGYYVEPTIVESKNPREKIMQEEIFGPVVTAYVYPDNEWREILDVINTTSPYGLTGSVYAQDEGVVNEAVESLKQTAGNFYINDQSTGSVVGQQPFGGARLSGTNDKAGGPHYVLKFCSPQSIKRTVVPVTEWKYPYMSS